jgi:hypothetical protein
VLTIIVAELLCVKREMSEGIIFMSVRPEDLQVEEMEMGGLLPESIRDPWTHRTMIMIRQD